jgi:hypothetical protein
MWLDGKLGRNQGTDRPAGHGKAVTSPDHIHAMQFRATQVVQLSGMYAGSRLSRSDRDCPLDTARARCLWHVGGTADGNDDAHAWR